MIKTWYMVVRGDGSQPRIVTSKKKPHLREDEIALLVQLRYPDGWKKVYDTGPVINVPPPPRGLKVVKP